MSNDLTLAPDPLDPHAFYDRFGNRYVFESHRDYDVIRRTQIIAWITRAAPLCFL